ncbi:uncharacterized protein LOC105698207 [Orussus abietinus]|uniref:uncharacterized protein LOC105698207 n=1 Tax=Orussus abietinus TaxID=222816 RepID=UPI0006253A60|nr:uncharacterized protein LOC105698207 [Orussus abietinus]
MAIYRRKFRSGMRLWLIGSTLMVFMVFFELTTAEAVTNQLQLHSCNFRGYKVYNTTDLLKCMNELASNVLNQSKASGEVKSRHLRDSPRSRVNFQFSHGRTGRPEVDPFSYYYSSKPSNSFHPSTPIAASPRLEYYQPGTRYPNLLGPNSADGPGSILYDALTSIARYDDFKCIPRILCEVASGTMPGSGSSQQREFQLENLGVNALISLLSVLSSTESAPLLNFAKATLTGYSSKGNPGNCFKEYPRCPRNPDDLVNYLNNHNGGFFRFFKSIRGNAGNTPQQGPYVTQGERVVYGQARVEQTPPLGFSNGGLVRTGELKFDQVGSPPRQYNGKIERGRNESGKIVFPGSSKSGDHPILNRVSKSFGSYQEPGIASQNVFSPAPPFFPQDGKSQEPRTYTLPNAYQRPQQQLGSGQVPGMNGNANAINFAKPQIYIPEEATNESIKTYTFPDGYKVKINVAFSKLFSDGYKKALRRSFNDDRGPHPVNFEGFRMVDLASLLSLDKARPDEQAVHPCDMICHDIHGTPVQFNQILSHSGDLVTLMAPDRPILDLSNPLPCEIICIDKTGERRHLSTTLSKVLRSSNGRQQSTEHPSSNDPSNQQPVQGTWSAQKSSGNRILRDRSSEPRKSPKAKQQYNTRIVRNFDQINPGNNPNLKEPQNMEMQRRTPYEVEEEPFYVNYAAGDPNMMPNFNDQPFMPEYQNPGSPLTRDFIPVQNDYHDENSVFPPGSINQHNLGSFFGGMPPMGMALPAPILAIPVAPISGIMGIMPMMAPPYPFMGYPGMPCNHPSCYEEQQPMLGLFICGGVLYFIPPGFIGYMPICAVVLPCVGSGSEGPGEGPGGDGGGGGFGTTTSQFSTEPTIPPGGSRRDPGGPDYPRESCLEGEHWNKDFTECVPIKYDRDAELKYTHLPGAPLSTPANKKMGRRFHKLKKKKKKLLIITDRGNITYVKAN